MRVTVFAVHGDGIHTHKSARFCRRHTNRVVNPPAAVKAVVAQRGASVAIPHKYYRRRKKWRYPRKSALEKPASIAAGIPHAAFACRAEARTHLRRAAAPNCASA